MPLDLNKLSLVSQHGVPGAPKIWLYTTTDSIATVNTANYFLNASKLLKANDIIIVWSSTGGTIDVSNVLVNSVTIGSAVDVTDGLSLLTGKQSGEKVTLQGVMPDVSTANSIYLAAPVAGDVTLVKSVLSGAITTGDAVLTVKDGAGNSMGTITIANSGSAAGDVDTLVPSSNEDVAIGELIEIATDGGSTVARHASIIIEITQTPSVDSD